MRKAVQAVVAIEGPVHIDVVQQRFRAAWHIGQFGSHIRARLDSAIRMSGVVRDGEFLHAFDRGDVRVRTPSEDCRRAVEQVHASELELAIVNLMRDTGGITSDDATMHVARLCGWKRTGSEIRSRLGTMFERLVANGALDRNGAERSCRRIADTTMGQGHREHGRRSRRSRSSWSNTVSETCAITTRLTVG
jgi:Protein of unknown function (DUF3320)